MARKAPAPRRTITRQETKIGRLLEQLIATLGYDESESATEWFACQIAEATNDVLRSVDRSHQAGASFDCVSGLAYALVRSTLPRRHARQRIINDRESLKGAAAWRKQHPAETAAWEKRHPAAAAKWNRAWKKLMRTNA